MAGERGRRAATLGALGALAVILLSGLFWKRFAVEYHLFRLQRESDYLDKILFSDDQTPAGEALKRFAGTGNGLSMLQKRYVEGMLEHLDRRKANFIGDPAAFQVGAGPMGFVLEREQWRVWYHNSGGGVGDSLYVNLVPGQGPSRAEKMPLVRIYKLLCGSRARNLREFSLPGYPGYSFRVLRGDLAFLITGKVRSDGKTPGRKEVVGVVRCEGQTGKISPCVVPLLVRSMKGPADFIPLAVEALENFGIDACDPLPGLIEMLKDDERGECCLGHSDCHPWLCTQLSPDRQQWIHPAARALMEIGAPALPPLSEALKRGKWSEGALFQAMLVFKEFGSNSIPCLEEVLSSAREDTRSAARRAISKIRELNPERSAR